MTVITKPLPGATIYYGHPINRGMVGYWLFNEGAGSQVASVLSGGSERGRGTITNVDLTSAWVGSPWGGGLSFDGVDDHVVVPRADFPSNFTSLSVVAWVNGSGVGANDAPVGDYNTAGNQRSWMLTSNSGADRIRVILSDDGGTAQLKDYRGSAGFEVYDNTWHQAGFTFHGPSSTLELFADGIADPSPTQSRDDAISSLHTSTSDMVFGAQTAAGGNWDGILSMVRIYDRAISAGEMQQLDAQPLLGLM